MATIDRQRRLKAVRDAMLTALRDGRARTRTELLQALVRDDYCGRNFSADALCVSIGPVVSTYDQDFYRDPSTGRISLTRRAQEWQRAEAEKHKRAAVAGGGTAAGRIADAMEAREAIQG